MVFRTKLFARSNNGFGIYTAKSYPKIRQSVSAVGILIGHDNNIPTMQFFTGIPGNPQSLTECVWEFQNDALIPDWSKLWLPPDPTFWVARISTQISHTCMYLILEKEKNFQSTIVSDVFFALLRPRKKPERILE